MLMLRRIGRSHWALGRRLHFGVHRHGSCWRLTGRPRLIRYGNGAWWLTWWRLFFVVQERTA